MSRCVLICALLCLATPGIVVAQDMPSVDPAHAEMGTVFYVSDPVNRNVVTFESEAPLEDIVGTSNQILGYVVFDPSHPDKGVHGKLVVPVASLETGIPMRDEHLRSPMWLNAQEHPHAAMTISGASDIKQEKSTEAFTTWSMNVMGEFMLNGHSKEITVPVTVTYLAESEKTKARMAGDLLAGRGEFEVALADFGVKGMKGVVGAKVSETIDVKVSFTATSQKPEMASR